MTVRLPLVVGFARAMELVITGRRIGAEEALRIGLVNEIVARGGALTRAQEGTGKEFLPAQVDVIGDTGHDIACGKAFGARTIAVATGSWSREKLAAEKPDFLFNDLGDVDDAIATLKW